jgi:peptide chain release factor subunit 1
MLQKKDLEELSQFQAGGYFVTSLYLNVDGKRFNKRDYEIKLKDLIRQRRQELENMGLSQEALDSIEEDFHKLSDYVSYQFDGRRAKSLAIFSCSALKFWKVFQLPQAVHPRLVVSKQPYIRPLAATLEENKRYLVILVSRDKARLFEYFMGELIEHTTILDEVPGRVKVAGWYGLAERRIERSIEDKVHRHYKHTAESAKALQDRIHAHYLIIGGRKESLPEFERHLHSTLQEKIVARIQADPDRTPDEIQSIVEKAIEDFEKKQQERLLNQLFEEAGSDGLGVLGLQNTLKALWNGQVRILFVTEDHSRPGKYCPQCYYMSANEETCPHDGSEMLQSHDIIEDAIETAILQHCELVRVKDPQYLEKHEHIGALLRFKV